MIVDIGEHDPGKGGGFKETVSYILDAHSKATKKELLEWGTKELQEHNRVAQVWASANLGKKLTRAGVAAAMQDVVDNANALKKAAGISNRGRKSTTSPIWTASLRQHPDVPQPTDDEVVSLFFKLLKENGLDPSRHQWVIAKHVEPSHPNNPDYHILVNKVSFVDGTRWNCHNDRRKMQTMCDDWDRERDINVTPARRARIDRARAWVKENPDPKKRDRSNPPHRAERVSWAERDALKAIRRDGLAEVAGLYEDQAKKLHDWDGEQFKTLRRLEQKASPAARRAAKQQAWDAYQAEIAAIKSGERAARAVAMMSIFSMQGIRKRVALFAANSLVADRHKKSEAVIKTMWSGFYRGEKTKDGQRRNAWKLHVEASRRGIKGVGQAQLARDAAARQELLKKITSHDRKTVKVENRKTMERVTGTTAALAQAKAQYQAQLIEIDKTMDATKERVANLRKSFYELNYQNWDEYVDMLREQADRRRSEMDLAAERQEREQRRREERLAGQYIPDQGEGRERERYEDDDEDDLDWNPPQPSGDRPGF